ncbi:hypothetical protein SDC9_173345 [bioreactor metagenome]|uniref:Uncharacterized protein n=1 Tax=bioreactor metagenome TaxID=1076179 RepID=A0A645GPP4_9ZZZZ
MLIPLSCQRGALFRLGDRFTGDRKPRLSRLKFKPGGLDFKTGSKPRLASLLAGSLQLRLRLSCLGARKFPIPKVPLGQNAGGVAPCSVIVAPAVVLIHAAERTDYREIPAACCSRPLRSTLFTLRRSANFRALGYPGRKHRDSQISRAGNRHLPFQTEQVPQHTRRDPMSVSGAGEIFECLGSFDFQVEHIRPQCRARLKPFPGQLKIRLKCLEG